MNKLLVVLVFAFVIFSIYQTLQLEIIKSELEIVQEHYQFAKETLDFFMDSPKGEEFTDEIRKNRNDTI